MRIEHKYVHDDPEQKGTQPLGQENVSEIREQQRPKKMCVEADGRKELWESATWGSLDFHFGLYFVLCRAAKKRSHFQPRRRKRRRGGRWYSISS